MCGIRTEIIILIVEIDDFDVLAGKLLTGCIIRSSNNEGEYVVGYRISKDSDAIRDYVSENYCE